MRDQVLTAKIDEQIVYNQLNENESAIWSLLLASGYLKVVGCGEYREEEYGPVEPERFFHGFVLGLIVELSGRCADLKPRKWIWPI